MSYEVQRGPDKQYSPEKQLSELYVIFDLTPHFIPARDDSSVHSHCTP